MPMNETLVSERKPVFWKKTKTGVVISEYLLKKFLIDKGFGLFQATSKRIGSKSIFQDDKGILRLHDEYSIKQFLLKYLEETDEDSFHGGGIHDYDHGDISKWDVLDRLQSFSPQRMLTTVIKSLNPHSEVSYEGTQKINIFDDTHDVAHIRFKNGVIKITQDSIDLVPYESLPNGGVVWESSIIDREIKIDENRGLFEDFSVNALSKRNRDKTNEDWKRNYDLDKEQYLSMRTSYGYMIHTHNTPDVQKCVYYIDCDSDLGTPQGGNGKSLVMESIKHFKRLVRVDGKAFRQNMETGGRFQFSMVDVDTKLVLIDDIRPEFDFDLLFSKITGDMEIERKGKDIFIIPAERSPKFGITTNYVIAGVGTSYTRRQHIVEFGNYWNYCNEVGESPTDEKHLGKALFDYNFTDDDWNQFYTYGFKCVQDYFRQGLVQASNQNHLAKARKMEVEGKEGDGTVTRWMEEWLENKRVRRNYHIDGISEQDLYDSFCKSNPEYTPPHGFWNKSKFIGSFFDFVKLHPSFEWNTHLSKKGDSKSARRELKGTRGNQESWVTITDNNSNVVSVKSQSDSDSEIISLFKEKFSD